VPARVSPADRIRGHIDELFAQDRPLPEILEEVARLGAQLLMQAALEAEVTEFLGRPPYPSAMKCLSTDREGLTAYLRFPAEHHNRVRHSNFIERTFGETRRRVKVIGRLPGETSCLTLVWAVLDRASAGWRGLTMTAGGLRPLQDLRHSLLEPPRQLRPQPATVTQPNDQPETATAVA
jgi:putative transposase